MADTNVEENKALARRFVEELQNKRQPELLDELCTTDHVIYHPALPKTVRGIEEARAATMAVFNDFTVLTFKIVDIIAEGDKVAVRFEQTHVMSEHGQGGKAAAGKRMDGTGITVYKVRDGKLASATIQEDILTMLHQANLVPSNNTMLYWMNKLGIVKLLQKLGKIPEGAPMKDISTEPEAPARS